MVPEQLSPIARWALIGLAAALAAFAAFDPVGVPDVVAALIAAASAGLAGLGILPPKWEITQKHKDGVAYARKGDHPKGLGEVTRSPDARPSNTTMGPQGKKASGIRRMGWKNRGKRASVLVAAIVALLVLVGGGARPAFAGYLHMDNCKGALTGGNGDNDWSRYWATFNPTPTYGVFNGYDVRYDANHVAAQMEWYNGTWHWFFGYCYGPDDSHITDNMPQPPSGF